MRNSIYLSHKLILIAHPTNIYKLINQHFTEKSINCARFVNNFVYFVTYVEAMEHMSCSDLQLAYLREIHRLPLVDFAVESSCTPVLPIWVDSVIPASTVPEPTGSIDSQHFQSMSNFYTVDWLLEKVFV